MHTHIKWLTKRRTLTLTFKGERPEWTSNSQLAAPVHVVSGRNAVLCPPKPDCLFSTQQQSHTGALVTTEEPRFLIAGCIYNFDPPGFYQKEIHKIGQSTTEECSFADFLCVKCLRDQNLHTPHNLIIKKTGCLRRRGMFCASDCTHPWRLC